MKASFILHCPDKEKGKGDWRFQPCRNGMNVIDPKGHVVCWFAHEEASKHLSLPSFWLDVKNIVLTTEQGTVIPFKPDPRDVGIVRQYLDDAVLGGGIEAVKGLKHQALFGLAAALAIVLVCVGAIYLIVEVLQVPDEYGKWIARPFAFVAIVVGPVGIAWAVYTLLRYRRLCRRWQEEQAGADAGQDLA